VAQNDAYVVAIMNATMTTGTRTRWNFILCSAQVYTKKQDELP